MNYKTKKDFFSNLMNNLTFHKFIVENRPISHNK